MLAQVLRSPKPASQSPLELAPLDTPAPGPDQILLRVLACGVCHTDLHIVEGDLRLPQLPIVPGHQVVGEVERVGEAVTRYKPGDRVGVPWLYETDRTCEFCRRGLENLCVSAQFTGLHVDGGFAEFMVVGADFAYALPEVFSDETAAPLLCAGIIGYRSLRLSDLRPGERLGLFGFGASAHLCIQVARHWGCEVLVFTRSPAHRRLAEELGAAWVGGSEDQPPALVDRAITFAPVGEIVPAALRVLRPGGTLAINAVHMSPLPEMDFGLIHGERTIRTVANATREDGLEFLKVAAEIPIRVEVETWPLADANRALLRLKRSEIRGSAVLRVADR